jgi:hypothetical protein
MQGVGVSQRSTPEQGVFPKRSTMRGFTCLSACQGARNFSCPYRADTFFGLTQAKAWAMLSWPFGPWEVTCAAPLHR